MSEINANNERTNTDSAVERVAFTPVWTSDCNGKQDLDGEILSLSTRYWPRGGGFMYYDPSQREKGLQGNETRPEVLPSATASIHLSDGEFDGDYRVLTTKDFEAETEDEVKQQVEEWAREQFCAILSAVNQLYGTRYTTDAGEQQDEIGAQSENK